MKKSIANIFQKFEAASRIQKVTDCIQKGVLKVGEHTYGYNNLEIERFVEEGGSNIIFGKYCSIARNVRIITGGIHPVDWVSTYPFRAKFNLEGKYQDGMPYSKGDIVVGNDVWIGAKVTILSGVKIGHGAVIATGALVNKDVPPYAMVGGVPAKLIKYRFSENEVKDMLNISWWDWSKEQILEAVQLLSSPSMDEFISKYKK